MCPTGGGGGQLATDSAQPVPAGVASHDRTGIQRLDTAEHSRRDFDIAVSELRYRQLIANLPGRVVLMFDNDLRVVVATGEVLNTNGYNATTMTGELLSTVIPAAAMAILEPHYRAALRGECADLDYTSPVGGQQFRMRIGPVIELDGTTVGGLSVGEDVTEERARQFELEHLHLLSLLGSCRYSLGSGWAFDQQLLDLWGIDSSEDASAAIADLIVAEDRGATLAAWASVRANGGKCATTFRIHHGKTGELRHVQSRQQAMIDADGTLIRAASTHVDITDSVNAREQAGRARILAAKERAGLLRRVSDALAASRSGGTDVLQNITEFAAVALDSAAALRVLTPDLDSLEIDLVAHPDEHYRERLTDALRLSSESIDRPSTVREEVIVKGRLMCSIGRRRRRPEFMRRFSEQTGWQIEQCIIAPVRHDGKVLGLFTVFRSDLEMPYEPGDDDLVQVLADSMGSAIAERRASAIAEQEQRELLRHLASTEAREREMLAEAIHDDPMQLIVAAMLRVDNLRLKNPGDDAEFDQVAETLETAVDRLRRLIIAVIPPDFKNGIGVALRNLAEGIFTGTKTTVNVVGPTHVTLTEYTKAAAYRILREALVNVRKHAGAQHVTIELEDGDRRVTVSITDDGIGSAGIEASVGHLGVLTMRTRARAEGGSLSIDSAPDRGTTVTLSLPVANGLELSKPLALRVFLVDDHESVRRGVAELLEDEDDLTVIGGASSVAEALALIPALRPDVAVLDVRLPDGNGIELCRELRSQLPNLHCLMLTSHTDQHAMVDAILAGASGYVIKDIRGVDLVAAVRTVGSGRSLLDNRAAAALMSQFRANVDGRAASAGLTEHEHLLLDLIGKGLTNRQIGQRMMEQPSIVTHDVNQLFAKLGTRRPVIGGRK